MTLHCGQSVVVIWVSGRPQPQHFEVDFVVYDLSLIVGRVSLIIRA